MSQQRPFASNHWRQSADVSQWDIGPTSDPSKWRRSVDASQLLSPSGDSQWELDNAEVAPSQWCNDWQENQLEAESPAWLRHPTRRRQLNSVTRRVATVIASRDCPRQEVRRMFSFQQQQPSPPKGFATVSPSSYQRVDREAPLGSSDDCEENSDGDRRKNRSDGAIELLKNSAKSSHLFSSRVFEDRNNNNTKSSNGINGHDNLANKFSSCSDIKAATVEADSEDDGLGAYPTFVLPGDNPLGDTDIEDLAEFDRRRVRGLACLELTALFAKHRCQPADGSAQSTVKQHRFLRLQRRGQDQDKIDGTQSVATSKTQAIKMLKMIRLLTQRLCREDALNTRGLFRVCGSVARVQALRRARSDVLEAAIVTSSIAPHDAAALLKAYLRELPRPLVEAPRDAGRFACLPRIPDETDRLFGLNLLVLLLPSEASSVLRELVELFAKVVLHRRQNQMTLQALATVVAPTLFPMQSPEQLLTDNGDLITAVEMLIKYRNIVWIVPDFTLRQIRRQAPPPSPPSGETMPRQPHAAVRLLRRIAGGHRHQQHQQQHLNWLKSAQQQQSLASPLSSPLSSTSSSQSLVSPVALPDEWNSNNASSSIIIQVRVGSADETSMVVKSIRVTPSTTAEEVVRRVGCEKFNCSLYEIGGNLCERRLKPNVAVLLVRSVNPGCGWWVK